MAYILDPGKIANFGETDNGAFVLITDTEIGSTIDVVDGQSKYSDLSKIIAYSANDILPIFAALSQPAHVLVVLPHIYFPSPEPDVIGSKRKLAILACNSTPTSPEIVYHFLTQASRTDPQVQENLAERFFSAAEHSAHIRFTDSIHGTDATFRIHEAPLQWHEQIGTLSWGQQQLLPSGEVSTLPVSVFGEDISSTLAIDGQLALKGFPVLHSGSQPVWTKDQQRLYESLSLMNEEAIIATVERGRVVKLAPSGTLSRGAAETLEAMYQVDSRYSTIVEVGFGVNTNMQLFAGNSAMNEVFGGVCGTVHFGFGLSPYTQYHLDVICPQTAVRTPEGITLFGPI
jgi:hypothetical protein